MLSKTTTVAIARASNLAYPRARDLDTLWTNSMKRLVSNHMIFGMLGTAPQEGIIFPQEGSTGGLSARIQTYIASCNNV